MGAPLVETPQKQILPNILWYKFQPTTIQPLYVIELPVAIHDVPSARADGSFDYTQPPSISNDTSFV